MFAFVRINVFPISLARHRSTQARAIRLPIFGSARSDQEVKSRTSMLFTLLIIAMILEYSTGHPTKEQLGKCPGPHESAHSKSVDSCKNARCIPGCECEPGYVRFHKTGKCITGMSCVRLQVAYRNFVPDNFDKSLLDDATFYPRPLHLRIGRPRRITL
ncbi:unnamed protein product [Cylicocyclus nassatus]|uniref:TIL domain-containing protein n=1 Tax=Cylicocyclus nassatus TaxID=53992 RepID=A0AA36LZK2_CYLNA|nr:unnamed protein product [Cylicocyclus nassatus]